MARSLLSVFLKSIVLLVSLQTLSCTEKNAKKNAELSTQLFNASQYGNASEVKRLLEAKADVNARDNDGHTAYDLALEIGHETTAKLLRDAMR